MGWEAAPQYYSGERWVLFSLGNNAQSQQYPYYFRLSSDGDFGYSGTWAVDRGVYPPPSVRFVQTTGCFRCAAGSYSEENATECLRCPNGRYSLASASGCTPCLNGTFASSDQLTESIRKQPECGQSYLAASRGSCTVVLAGASSCTICAAGKFALAEAGECTQCAPGSFSETGASVCQACPGGKWSGLGYSSCVLCPAGRVRENASAVHPDDCELCELGTYSGSEGQTACVNCPAGSFAMTRMMSACSLCAPGSHAALPGASMCDTCPMITDSNLSLLPQLAGQTSCPTPL